MFKRLKSNNLKNDERGIISFFVTIIIMIVLSLVVLGFSQVARADQTDALNRQLSLEAYYAAESGVNDAYAVVRYIDNVYGGSPGTNIPVESQNCLTTDAASPYTYVSGTSNLLDTTNATQNIKYTCVLVNPNPTTLGYSNVAAGQAVITELLSDKSTNPITTLNINYSQPNQDVSCSVIANGYTSPNTPTLLPQTATPATSQWPSDCPPVLRIDLVPITSSDLSQSGLAANVRTFFVYPSNRVAGSGANWSAGSFNNAVTYTSVCSGAINNNCSFVLSGLNPGGTNTPYYMRILYTYGTAPTYNLSATGPNGQVSFAGSQVEIDATGVAGNVLRRISVHASLSPITQTTPNAGIETNNTLCKRITVGGVWYDENIPSPAPSDGIPAPLSQTYNSNGVAGAGGSVTDSCNPLY